MNTDEQKIWDNLVKWYRIADTVEDGDMRPMGPLTRVEKNTILAVDEELRRLRCSDKDVSILK